MTSRKFCIGAAASVIIISATMVLGMEISNTIKAFGISLLIFGAISGFGMAKNIYQPREPEHTPDARTPDQMRADTNAHTQTYEDMVAQG